MSIEGVEELARALAARFTLARDAPGHGRPFFARLDCHARVLRDAYRTLA